MSTSDSHYDSCYHAARFPELISDDNYFWARAEVQARFYFTAAEQRLRVFEYGCGIGQGIAALPNATGWDVSKKALDECRRRGLRVVEDREAVPRGEWDIVFCRHVLEHLEEPLTHLKFMRDLIAPDGEVYLIRAGFGRRIGVVLYIALERLQHDRRPSCPRQDWAVPRRHRAKLS